VRSEFGNSKSGEKIDRISGRKSRGLSGSRDSRRFVPLFAILFAVKRTGFVRERKLTIEPFDQARIISW
jgi:hypothetical protein